MASPAPGTPHAWKDGPMVGPKVVAGVLILATVACAIVVSIRIGTFEFFWVVVVPLAVVAAISYWFRSWLPVVGLAGAYLYLMLFWLVGYAGDFVDEHLAGTFASATGVDRTAARIGAYIAVWVLFVVGCEFLLNRFSPRKYRP